MPLISNCGLTSSVQQRAWNWNRHLLFFGLLLLVSLGTRLLSAQDARIEGLRVQSAVVADYKRAGRLYREHLSSFFNDKAPLNNPDLLSHPPGYSLLWALIFKLNGADRAMQLLQILCDLASAFVLFLIASELLQRSVAVIASLLVSLAPQFTWNSVILLPDTIAVLPILLAIYFLIVAAKRQLRWAALAAGMLIGVSCWLRPNALLLAPFCCLFVPFLFTRGNRLRSAAAIVVGTLLVVAPLTIRNAIVFHHFVPVSLGAGQTMLEGIGDYDRGGQFGIPNTDIEIMRQEAEASGRPEYAETLFGADGIARDRMRLARALGVIRTHPFWFVSVMSRRAASMFRLERSPIVAPNPLFHPLPHLDAVGFVWAISPQDLIAQARLFSPSATMRLSPDGLTAELTGDDSKYGLQLISNPVRVKDDTEYLLTVPIRIRQGRSVIEVVTQDRGRVYARGYADAVRGLSKEEQRMNTIQLPFVTRDNEDVSLTVSNGGSKPEHQVAEIGTLKLFELGPASQTWTQLPRMALRSIQRLFITAVALPLMLLGLIVLLRARCWRTLAILLLVPAYYVCFQSAIHTEYRYVLALHYFLFIIVATGIWFLGTRTKRLWPRVVKSTFFSSAHHLLCLRV